MKKICLLLLGLASLASHSLFAVELKDQQQRNFGLQVVSATSTQTPLLYSAVAQVLDASSLITALADLRAATAAIESASAELKRSEQLQKADNNVAMKDVEAARAQLAASEAHVRGLRGQLIAAWGGAIAKLDDKQLAQLLDDLLANRVVLIRAELNSALQLNAATRVRLRAWSSDTSLEGKLLGVLPQRAGQAPGSAYLLSAKADTNLQVNQTLTAELTDTAHPLTGIKLPRAALVRWQGKEWIYVQQDQTHFERRAVVINQWLEDGVLVSEGVKAGERVVSAGAALLLGAETNVNSAAEE